MSSESPVAVPPTVGAPSSAHLSEDARWVAWKARGAREDLLVRGRLRVVLPLLAVAAAGIFYAVMVR
jgi:hypothetical protein